MKVLLYGLQSSGASLFCYFMAQKPLSIGVVDLNNHRVAPDLDVNMDVTVKAVITTRWSLEDHLESYKPDKTILFLRNPYNNYYSLRDKKYANKSGDIDDKFRLLESYYSSSEQFDQVITYEGFIQDHDDTVRHLNEIGWSATTGYYSFPRTLREVYLFNCYSSEWCRNNPAAPGPEGGWGMGNISGGSINLALAEKPYIADLDEKVRLLCPTLHDYYSKN